MLAAGWSVETCKVPGWSTQDIESCPRSVPQIKNPSRGRVSKATLLSSCPSMIHAPRLNYMVVPNLPFAKKTNLVRLFSFDLYSHVDIQTSTSLNRTSCSKYCARISYLLPGNL